jgi:hypothetical protein
MILVAVASGSGSRSRSRSPGPLDSAVIDAYGGTIEISCPDGTGALRAGGGKRALQYRGLKVGKGNRDRIGIIGQAWTVGDINSPWN